MNKYFISLILLICASLSFAGGGEGSSGGGAGVKITQMMEVAKRSSYELEIPQIKISKKNIPVIQICVDQDEVRTFSTTDHYPQFIDIYTVPQGIEQKVDQMPLKKSYPITLFKKIDIHNANMRINTRIKEERVDYQIPKCVVRD